MLARQQLIVFCTDEAMLLTQLDKKFCKPSPQLKAAHGLCVALGHGV
jgi:hypothetical protein